MKNRKKEISTLIIGILILITLIVGTTYAFFQARVGKGESVEANIKTGTLGTLTFTKGEDITINVIPKDFELGGENAEGKTNLKALLLTEYTDETEYTYNVYLEILKNNLEYSSFKDKEGKLENLVFKTNYEKTLGNNIDYNGLTNGYEGIPELLLTVTGPETFTNNIEGLNKATLQEIDDSYDITQLREGIYPIAEDIPIKVLQNDGGLKEDEWEVKVTYKNLENTQIINLNREFKARVRIQKEKIANDLMDVCQSGDNLAECIKKLHNESEYGASNLIYHDGEPDYKEETNYQLEAGDNSYRYTGSYDKVNNYICLGSSCSTNPTNDNYHNLYRIVGVFGEDGIKVVKADYANKNLLGEGTQKPEGDDLSQADSTTYGSYAGTVYKVGSGNNEEQDAAAHRYKGSLAEVDRYRWQKLGDVNTPADWKTALLNKIHLNNVYWSKIDSKYQSLIKDHDWIYKNTNSSWRKIGIAQDVKTAYNNELGLESLKGRETDQEKIGLLYVSDYLYGASSKNWSKQPFTGIWLYKNPEIKDKFNYPVGSFPENEIDNDYRSSTDSNWLYMGLWEWLQTINNDRDIPVGAFRVDASGRVGNNDVGTSTRVVRPSFYINNETKIISGTGTFKDPYTLDLG